MKRSLMKIVALTSLLATTAWAGPTAQLAGGTTSVKLDKAFVGALDILGVSPGGVEPGDFDLSRRQLRYDIPAGAIDLESLAGDIFHTGGLTLSVPGTKVSLLNFIIDTTGSPVLTGLASVNGDVVARLPLFDLDLSEVIVRVTDYGRLRVLRVGLTLTPEAASTLNSVFGTDALSGGFPIGTANVNTNILDVVAGDSE